MLPSDDMIVVISKTLGKFFGCSGKMLKPSRATIEAFINEIPEDRLVTTDLMRKELARWHGVEVTCPYDTRMVLQSIANDPQTQVPYWRVLKANGEINPNYPGGQQGHAVQIQAAGFNLETAGKVLRVSQYKHSLVQFD
jgi:hypothetical protein